MYRIVCLIGKINVGELVEGRKVETKAQAVSNF
jgi:hypothetical protein